MGKHEKSRATVLLKRLSISKLFLVLPKVKLEEKHSHRKACLEIPLPGEFDTLSCTGLFIVQWTRLCALDNLTKTWKYCNTVPLSQGWVVKQFWVESRVRS